MQSKSLLFISGLLILFVVYHFPEFFSAFWIAAVCKITFLFIAFFIARWQKWNGLGGFGLSVHKGWIKNLLLGLVIGILFFLFSEFMAVSTASEKFISIKGLPEIIKGLPLILLMTFFPSIAEDILTRGYVYGHLHKKWRPVVFIMASSLFYVLNHIWRLNEGIAVLSYLFVLGVALAWSLSYTRSLWLALGIHWGANIGFEMINAAAKTKTIDTITSTWLLAASYFLMFVTCIAIRKLFSVGPGVQRYSTTFEEKAAFV